jgi:hypothetical protein
VDLDDRMRGQLRFWGVVSVFVLLGLIVSSLYFYIQWQPVTTFIDAVLRNVHKSIEEKGEIPKWVVTVGIVWFTVLFVVSLFFFYFLIDFGKAHYKIDRVTLRIIPHVGNYIKNALLERLECPATSECALFEFSRTPSGSRRFMNELFYHFANRDSVGTHNQLDKRREVFGFWTKYYVFNYVMLICLLCWLWICFLALIRSRLWAFGVLVLGVIPYVFFWRWRGHYYKQGAIDLASDQVNAFFNQAKPEIVAQAAALIKRCGFGNCPVKPSTIARP